MPHLNKELHDKILKITLLIRETYPELSKFLDEMPVTVPDQLHPHLNTKAFADYYESLKRILEKYTEEHNLSLKKHLI